MEKYLKNKLGQGDNRFFIVFTLIAAFGAYFCMYAFRKPFSVATYADLSFFRNGFENAFGYSSGPGVCSVQIFRNKNYK
ncbi:MAG: hypothetical protein R2784_05515 [Saprospiraceae bacterium]